MTSRSDQEEASVFQAANLLREARRQRGLLDGTVPSICLLDPDGDFVTYLRTLDETVRSPFWACYHTEMWESNIGGVRVGVVGCAVGAPFAVLVAEQLFASGCELLISVTSAGQLAPDLALPCFILIDQAFRGEGTSHCYLPPAAVVDANAQLLERAANALATTGVSVRRGAVWTTDAPYRETETAIAKARGAGALAVEMEAAALYAVAQAKEWPILCLAHVTNQMASIEGDFEKGPEEGAHDVLRVVAALATTWTK